MSGRSHFAGFPKPIQPTDWAKLAAFLDGEGCIAIQRQDTKGRHRAKSPRHVLHMWIGNTDPRLPLWCEEFFGGKLYFRECSKRSSKHRDAYMWNANSLRAVAIVEGCLPFFVLKREQGEVALAFAKIARAPEHGKVVPVAMIQQREEMKQQLSDLKTLKFPVLDRFKKQA